MKMNTPIILHIRSATLTQILFSALKTYNLRKMYILTCNQEAALDRNIDGRLNPTLLTRKERKINLLMKKMLKKIYTHFRDKSNRYGRQHTLWQTKRRWRRPKKLSNNPIWGWCETLLINLQWIHDITAYLKIRYINKFVFRKLGKTNIRVTLLVK